MERNSVVCFFVFLSLVLLLSGCKEGNEALFFGNFEQDEWRIPAGFAGKIAQLTVKEGDLVEQGDLLALIDTLYLSLELERIEASKRALEASIPSESVELAVYMEGLSSVESELSRVERLVESGAAKESMAITLREKLSLVKSEYNVAKERIRQKRVAVEGQVKALDAEGNKVKEKLSECSVTAPFDGKIFNLYFKEGEYVDVGLPILTMAPAKIIHFSAWVPGSHLYALSLGDTVLLYSDRSCGELKEFKGRVTSIAERAQFIPSMIETREERVKQHYRIKIEVENDGTLKPGMAGEMKLLAR